MVNKGLGLFCTSFEDSKEDTHTVLFLQLSDYFVKFIDVSPQFRRCLFTAYIDTHTVYQFQLDPKSKLMAWKKWVLMIHDLLPFISPWIPRFIASIWSMIQASSHQFFINIRVHYWSTMLGTSCLAGKVGKNQRLAFLSIDSQCDFSKVMMCNVINAAHLVMPIRVTIQLNLGVHQSRIGRVRGTRWRHVWWHALSFTVMFVFKLLYVNFLRGKILHWKSLWQSLNLRHNQTVIRKQKQGGRGDRRIWRPFVSFFSMSVNGGSGKLIGEDFDNTEWQCLKNSLNFWVVIIQDGIFMPISKLEVWHNNSQHSFSNITVNYVPHQFFCVTFISSNQNLILWQDFCS